MNLLAALILSGGLAAPGSLERFTLERAIETVWRDNFSADLARCGAARVVVRAVKDGAPLPPELVLVAAGQADVCAADQRLRRITPDPA